MVNTLHCMHSRTARSAVRRKFNNRHFHLLHSTYFCRTTSWPMRWKWGNINFCKNADAHYIHYQVTSICHVLSYHVHHARPKILNNVWKPINPTTIEIAGVIDFIEKLQFPALCTLASQPNPFTDSKTPSMLFSHERHVIERLFNTFKRVQIIENISYVVSTIKPVLISFCRKAHRC